MVFALSFGTHFAPGFIADKAMLFFLWMIGVGKRRGGF
jgi:hypothetical protein